MKKIQNIQLDGKTVLLRADLDIPIQNKEITDDTRLEFSLETINYLIQRSVKVVIIGHLGRPSGKDENFSLDPIAKWYEKKFGELRQTEYKGFNGWEIGNNLILLENIRFYKEEEKNDDEFSKKLASLAEIYVNDAFASSHRAHCSIVGITKFISSFAGLRLQKEVDELSKVLDAPKRPLTIIIGGAKIETKLPLVEKMHHFADYVLVGGEIAEKTKELAKVSHEKLTGKKSILLLADLTNDTKDITEYSTQNFAQVIGSSKTIVWNGPMGLVEDCFDLGTRDVAKAISSSSAYTIVGGGDTVAFLKKEGILEKFSFVSMGGGAMLEFLAGIYLPGLKALDLS